MAEKKQRSNMATARFGSGNGNTLRIEFNEVEDDYVCPECAKEITKKQLEDSYVDYLKGSTLTKFNANVDDILVHLNKYRKDYKIDTCLRKAQFITQVATETKYLSALDESFYYQCHKIESKFPNEDITLSPVNLETYKDILEIIDTNDYEEKEKPENYSNYSINAAYVYGYAKKEYEIELTDDKKIKVKVKKHKPNEKVIGSRMYHSKYGNGNNKSFDGYRYRGRGLMHLTWKSNYEAFAAAYDNESFEDKSDKLNSKVKIATDTDSNKVEGNYDLLSEAKYAVHSGLWFWAKFRKVSGKRPPEYADEDNIIKVSYAVNGGINGIDTRKKVLPKARKAFKVYDHYQNTYDNGTDEQKERVKTNIELISSKHTEKIASYSTIVKADSEAAKILEKIKEAEAETQSTTESTNEGENTEQPSNEGLNSGK